MSRGGTPAAWRPLALDKSVTDKDIRRGREDACPLPLPPRRGGPRQGGSGQRPGAKLFTDLHALPLTKCCKHLKKPSVSIRVIVDENQLKGVLTDG